MCVLYMYVSLCSRYDVNQLQSPIYVGISQTETFHIQTYVLHRSNTTYEHTRTHIMESNEHLFVNPIMVHYVVFHTDHTHPSNCICITHIDLYMVYYLFKSPNQTSHQSI